MAQVAAAAALSVRATEGVRVRRDLLAVLGDTSGTLMLLRHLLSVLLLPFVVVVVVPYALLDGAVGHLDLNTDSLWPVLRMIAGAAPFLGGLVLAAWSVRLFATIGRGTLAPWDPTRNLVAAGPYRYVRNPMISGVVLILLGEALIWGSEAVGTWAGAVLLINHFYFLLVEEPGLERRFGEAYRVYKAQVPRWTPRTRPWTGIASL